MARKLALPSARGQDLAIKLRCINVGMPAGQGLQQPTAWLLPPRNAINSGTGGRRSQQGAAGAAGASANSPLISAPPWQAPVKTTVPGRRRASAAGNSGAGCAGRSVVLAAACFPCVTLCGGVGCETGPLAGVPSSRPIVRRCATCGLLSEQMRSTKRTSARPRCRPLQPRCATDRARPPPAKVTA